MEKKVVANKKIAKKVSRTKVPSKKPTPSGPAGPGYVERAYMCIHSILKLLIGFVENRINKLKARRLARKMDGEGKS